MNVKWKNLIENIQSFNKNVFDLIDNENKEFHEYLNSIEDYNFLNTNITVSEFLFWHDQTGYWGQYEDWQNEHLIEKHLEVKDYLISSGQKNDFYLLVQAIEKKRIAPFIGAGLSVPCGYPLWRDALLKLLYQKLGYSDIKKTQSSVLDEIKNKIDQSLYTAAAELLSL